MNVKRNARNKLKQVQRNSIYYLYYLSVTGNTSVRSEHNISGQRHSYR